MGERTFTNALIHETSPYLLQHAHNPIEWFPWGPEALAKAKAEDKPILLSIGYSACHWCHVMAHESFEDEEIAKLMNQNFISIKVDREERPDLDSIYMTAVQLMTGSGGWPMTVFLTPDQRPFYCGTYFPKDDRYGVPGFRRILLSISQAYREKKHLLVQDAEIITAELQKSGRLEASQADLNMDILRNAAIAIASDYDPVNGGFGRAPKFPPSMALSFLMRSSLKQDKDRYLEIIHNTLRKMASGGMYDQVGGGFHRYSVDAQWLVPHFEKMLYDNALLSRLYIDAFLLTVDGFYRKTAEEILDYVCREMTSAEGGFYSSQDADSEGREGAFFLWTINEIQSLLGEEDANLFCRYYGVTAEGNFEGMNILHVSRPADWVARQSGLSEECLQEILQRSRAKLFEARERRPKPGRDEKILTAWNGLMLRSFADAAKVLMREDYRRIAIRNAEFLLANMRRDGNLLRSCKDGHAKFNAYLEDYACLIDGLLSLYEATFDLCWMRDAEELAERMIQKFRDPQGGGFFFTSDDHESLIHRPKDFYDSATPSGNSAAASALLRLAKYTGRDELSRHAMAILEKEAGLMMRQPAAVPHLLGALDFLLSGTREIAIIGDPQSEVAQGMLAEAFHRFLPNTIVACGPGGGLPLLDNRPQLNGLVTAYVCENSVCRQPVTSRQELRRLLA